MTPMRPHLFLGDWKRNTVIIFPLLCFFLFVAILLRLRLLLVVHGLRSAILSPFTVSGLNSLRWIRTEVQALKYTTRRLFTDVVRYVSAMLRTMSTEPDLEATPAPVTKGSILLQMSVLILLLFLLLKRTTFRILSLPVLFTVALFFPKSTIQHCLYKVQQQFRNHPGAPVIVENAHAYGIDRMYRGFGEKAPAVRSFLSQRMGDLVSFARDLPLVGSITPLLDAFDACLKSFGSFSKTLELTCTRNVYNAVANVSSFVGLPDTTPAKTTTVACLYTLIDALIAVFCFVLFIVCICTMNLVLVVGVCFAARNVPSVPLF